MSADPAAQKPEIQTVEVHNVWTIYGMENKTKESNERLAVLNRPQDWGDPRWHYHLFRFEWVLENVRYINNCHCWTDLSRKEHEYPQLFAELIVQVLMPGTPERFCAPGQLKEDDFWNEEWGPLPPYAKGEDEDYYSDGEFEDEEENVEVDDLGADE